MYVLIIYFIVVIERVIKDHMEQTLPDGGEPLEGKYSKIYYRKLHNTGAAFNFMKDNPKGMRLLHAVILAYVMLQMFREKGPACKLGLALLSGGGLSNYLDRRKHGYVRDYVSFRFGPKWFRDIVFNVSDFCVFAGALLVCVGRVRRR